MRALVAAVLGLVLGLGWGMQCWAGVWAVVDYVNDGDTVTVIVHGRRELVRLIGVDAPETIHSKALARRAARHHRSPLAEARLGEAARRFLAGLLPRGSRVRLSRDSFTPMRDRHGRLLRYVWDSRGRLVNLLIIRAGMARAFRKFHYSYKRAFLAAEARARAERAGLWAKGGP